MSTVAVVAHARKSLGGGLPELREVLAREGFGEPLWYEVTKSRKAPKRARRALAEGAELILVWGGDGMVQRCVDASKGSNVAPPAWGFRRTSPKRSRSGCAVNAASSTWAS